MLYAELPDAMDVTPGPVRTSVMAPSLTLGVTSESPMAPGVGGATESEHAGAASKSAVAKAMRAREVMGPPFELTWPRAGVPGPADRRGRLRRRSARCGSPGSRGTAARRHPSDRRRGDGSRQP